MESTNNFFWRDIHLKPKELKVILIKVLKDKYRSLRTHSRGVLLRKANGNLYWDWVGTGLSKKVIGSLDIVESRMQKSFI